MACAERKRLLLAWIAAGTLLSWTRESPNFKERITSFSTRQAEYAGFYWEICWRRGSESNRRIKVLQTSPLPLGYRALQLPKFSLTSGNSPSDGKALAGAGLGPEFWSGRRDLNPRLRPWQGRTLPLSYSRSFCSSERPSRPSGFRQQAPAC